MQHVWLAIAAVFALNLVVFSGAWLFLRLHRVHIRWHG